VGAVDGALVVVAVVLLAGRVAVEVVLGGGAVEVVVGGVAVVAVDGVVAVLVAVAGAGAFVVFDSGVEASAGMVFSILRHLALQ